MVVVLDLAFAKQVDDIRAAIVLQYIAQNSIDGKMNCKYDDFVNAFPFPESATKNILSALQRLVILRFARRKGMLEVYLPPAKFVMERIRLAVEGKSIENSESILVFTEFLEDKKILTKTKKTSSKNVVKTKRKEAKNLRTKELGRYFVSKHKGLYGVSPQIDYQRDVGLLNKLPLEWTVELLKPTIDAFFSQESWEKKNIGPTIPAWVRTIPKHLKPLTPTNQKKRLVIPGVTENT